MLTVARARHATAREKDMNNASADILICGGGIIGLTVARELVRAGRTDIVIIEKERALGEHASGRNSGVLHAGIYYTPDSMKAKSCLAGNRLMKEYCREKNLPLRESGKVIVAKNEGEIATLHELHARALKNSARVELIDEKQLASIEPNARTSGKALLAHDTAVVDPKAILKKLSDELVASNKVSILLGTEFRGLKTDRTVATNRGDICFQFFINAAGAFSDTVASAFGLQHHYRLIPFKGMYKKLARNNHYNINSNIYPVPDLRNPFLGVHFTKTITGDVYLGPTAIPALGRENYGLVKGADSELFDILWREAVLFCVNPKFRTVALSEPKKYIQKNFFNDARKLVRELMPQDVIASHKVGIRPQLVDWKKKELVMDFLVVKDGNSIHILNAISPAFTSSMYFAGFIVKEYVNN